tara:strand:- start:369 stop:542 length:174 start_codon:yes stop_codon:yes gene_type:complete
MKKTTTIELTLEEVIESIINGTDELDGNDASVAEVDFKYDDGVLVGAKITSSIDIDA